MDKRNYLIGFALLMQTIFAETSVEVGRLGFLTDLHKYKLTERADYDGNVRFHMDIEYLEELIIEKYPGYEYFGPDNWKEAFSYLSTQTVGSTRLFDFRSMLIDSLGFIKDTHFTIDGAIISEFSHIYYDYNHTSSPKQIRVFNGTEFDKIGYTVNRNTGSFLLRRNTNDEIQFFRKIDGLYNSSNGYSEEFYNNLYVLKVHDFGFDDSETDIEDFTNSSQHLLNHERVIVDLRGNSGGSSYPIIKWFQRLVGNAMPYPFLVLKKTSPFTFILEEEKLRNEDAVRNHYSTVYERLPEKIKMKEIIVLIDNRTCSAGEEFCYLLDFLFKATIMGTNSCGMSLIGGTREYELPVSKIKVRFGKNIPLFPNASSVDGFGIMPDILYISEIVNYERIADMLFE